MGHSYKLWATVVRYGTQL